MLVVLNGCYRTARDEVVLWAGMAQVRIKLFGGLSVSDGSTVIEQFSTRRSAQLLAKVALSRQGAVSRDELAEELWPEDFLDATRARLRQELTRLRAALGPFAEILVSDRTWVRVDFDLAEVDVRTFERLFKAAKLENDPGVKLDMLHRVCAHVEGVLLPEFSLPWAVSERAELRTRAIEAYGIVLDSLRQSGKNSDMEEIARRALKMEPLEESFALALAESLVATGKREAAKASLANFKAAKVASGDPRIGQELTDFAANLDEAVVFKGRVALPQDQPEFADPFIGREEELAALGSWLGPGSTTRVITILGPGGMGKTRLATELLRAQHYQPHEVAFMSLENMDPESILGRVQDVAGHSGLRLLVLDNAESSLKPAADAANHLLKHNRMGRVLVTSRQRVRIAGEQVLTLAPMASTGEGDLGRFLGQPAVKLFVDRVKQSDPSFTVTEETHSAVQKLLDQLDGLPLAIELAAARCASLGLDEVAERIGDRFALLQSRRQDTPDRQRSLFTIIDWSYRALTLSAQEALCGLSLIPGRFGLKTAEKALLKRGLVDDIEELRESSLLTANPSSNGLRYRLLDSVRAYGAEQVNAAESREIEGRLAQAMLEVCEEVRPKFATAEEEDANARLDSEQDCLMWACEWGLLHDLARGRRLIRLTMRYWFNGGYPRDAIRLGTRLLEADQDCPEDLKAGVAMDVARAYFLIGDLEASEEWYKRGQAMYQGLGDPSMELYCYLNFGAIDMDRGDHESMVKNVEKALGMIGDGRGSLYQRGITLGMLGRGHALLGRVKEGMARTQEAMEARLSLGYELEIARGYRELAEVFFESGELEKAWTNYEIATERIADHPYHMIALSVVRTGIEVAIEQGKTAALPDLFRRARVVMDRLGSELDEIALDRLRARFALLQNDVPAAVSLIRRALEQAIASGNERQLAESILIACEVLFACGRDVSHLVARLLASTFPMPPSRLRLAARIAGSIETGERGTLSSLATEALSLF